MNKFFIFVIFLYLVGCVPPVESSNIVKRISTFYLEDGTRCVLYRGNRAEAGISCDWGSNDE